MYKWGLPSSLVLHLLKVRSHCSPPSVLYFQVEDVNSFRTDQQQHAVQNGEVNNIEKLSTIVRTALSFGLTPNSKPSVNNDWGSDVTNKSSSVLEKQEFNTVDSKQVTLEMDEGVGCDVIDSDNNEEDDDDVDDDDEDYNLVMNMEVSDDLKGREDLPTVTPFVPVSVPPAGKSATSLAVKTLSAPTQPAAAVSSDNLPAQVAGAELPTPKHPATPQTHTEQTAAKVPAGVGCVPSEYFLLLLVILARGLSVIRVLLVGRFVGRCGQEGE